MAAIDASELRLDISKRGLLTGTATVQERAEVCDLRGRVVLVLEG